MRRSVKIWIIVAASLICAGAIILGGVVTMNGSWNITNLFKTQYEVNEYSITDEFHDIVIKTSTADIEVVSSQSQDSSVICHERENLRYEVTVTDGVLEIKLIDSRKWYEHISFFSVDTASVKLVLPVGEYGDLTVKNSTGDVSTVKEHSFEKIDISVSTGDIKNYASSKGDIEIKTTTGDVKNYASSEGKIKIKTETGDITADGVSAESVELSVDTGRIKANGLTCQKELRVTVDTGKCELVRVSCGELTSKGNTGDISMTSLISEGRIDIERDTGDVRFEYCDAVSVEISTETGDVKGSFLTDKVVYADTDTGRIDIPRCKSGGICEITTDTGDIKISIKK